MNKKAVSELVAFVLLVGLSVALAGGVYAWLKLYVQKPLPEESCPDVSIIIVNYTCEGNTITLNVQNKGLFNVSGFMAKMNDLSETDPGGKLAGRYPLIPQCYPISLGPGDIAEAKFSYLKQSIKQIELEPFRGTCSKLSLCDKAILRQSISNCP